MAGVAAQRVTATAKLNIRLVIDHLHRSRLIGVMPARHRAFSGEVRSDVGCLGPARDVLSPNDFAVASSGQGQHLSEENIVTRIYSLGNGRAVYPEEREREHA